MTWWRDAFCTLLGIICGAILAYMLTAPTVTRAEVALEGISVQIGKLSERITALHAEIENMEIHLQYDDHRIDDLQAGSHDPPPGDSKHEHEKHH